MIFFSPVNPARISGMINENASLFTTAISYDTITNTMGRALKKEWILQSDIHALMLACAVVVAGILLCAVGGCMSVGNNRMKKRGVLFPLCGSAVMFVGLQLIRSAYARVYSVADAAGKLDTIKPMLPDGLLIFTVAAALIFASSIAVLLLNLQAKSENKMEMDEKYRLFLMFLPVLLLTFVFAYLPIYGWRFAFYDYRIGDALTQNNYVGFYWFRILFENEATRADIVRVLRNTLAMSGLGILTSWLPIAFAVLLAELRSSKFQRIVQTLTTIPNFISWVLVYAIALAIFSTDGFINSFIRNVLGHPAATDYLANADHTWLKMLLWGTWKGVGWSAIIYIAGIAGIDQQLYEAARVDGANRFHCIWHITIPGLLPTYMVMLLMSIAGILSNGMEQYLVFENPLNGDVIQVLDLYVYQIGIGKGQIPLSTVVGITKSLVGVVLLFGANGISKVIRGESII
ncbi:MAG: sugar ABC transporter permease [Clostridia bacterium]|nr:sugar ABC transporter permease [Clostridia bacterium]